jgi:hypothetical protein
VNKYYLIEQFTCITAKIGGRQPSNRELLIGRGEMIRTSDLSVPNRAHYRAVLRPEKNLMRFIQETYSSAEFYRRKSHWSSSSAVKSRKNRIIFFIARARWLISPLTVEESSPNVSV